MNSGWTNIAEHDPEIYDASFVEENGGLFPLCPVCKSMLKSASNRESNSVWFCPNFDRNGEGKRRCAFIEGKLSRRKAILWDCRYEPSLKRQPQGLNNY